MPTHDEIMAAGGSDVGDFGEKQLSGYTRPFKVAGEEVEIDKLPAFGSAEGDDTVSPMGDLESTGDTGDFDIYEGETPAP
jgi:hypothetical protein